MYANGQGVAQNYQQALVWYQKAANQGFAPAQHDLGVMYYKGHGVATNYQQAKALWQKVLAQPDTEDNVKVKAYARDNLQELKKVGIR